MSVCVFQCFFRELSFLCCRFEPSLRDMTWIMCHIILQVVDFHISTLDQTLSWCRVPRGPWFRYHRRVGLVFVLCIPLTMCVSLSVCVCVSALLCISVNVCVSSSMWLCMPACLCVRVRVCLGLNLSVDIYYECVCVCVCVREGTTRPEAVLTVVGLLQESRARGD